MSFPRLVLVALVALPSLAGAVPVRVLSRAHIDMAVDKRWDSLQVTATLTDDLGAPIPMAEVALSIAGWGDRRSLTDGAGRAEFQLDPADLDRLMGVYVEDGGGANVALSVSFGGTPRHGAANARQVIDLTRETLQLQAVVSPHRIDRGQPPRILAVLRHGSHAAAGLPVVVTIGDQAARVVTSPSGRAIFRSFEPPEPGEYRVRIEFPGSERFNPVAVERDLTVVVRTAVEIERVDDGTDPMKLTVRGRLSELGGGPLPGRVGLTIDDAPYAWVDAGEDGEFAATLDLTREATRAGPRPARLRGIYAPTESWEIAGRSPAIAFDVPSPPRVPLEVYLVPLFVLGGALLLATLLRGGQLAALARWIRERFARDPQRASAAPRGRRRVEPLPAAAASRLAGTRRDVTGEVWDDHLELPLAGADVAIMRGGELVAHARTDEEGGFALRDLPEGDHHLVLGRSGFVTEEVAATIPHRGQLTAQRFGLMPVRARTLAAYRRLVDKRTGGRGHFGTQTPREIEQLLTSGDAAVPATTARAATEAFEALYFGGDHRVTEARHGRAVEAFGEAERAPEGS